MNKAVFSRILILLDCGLRCSISELQAVRRCTEVSRAIRQRWVTHFEKFFLLSDSHWTKLRCKYANNPSLYWLRVLRVTAWSTKFCTCGTFGNVINVWRTAWGFRKHKRHHHLCQTQPRFRPFFIQIFSKDSLCLILLVAVPCWNKSKNVLQWIFSSDKK